MKVQRNKFCKQCGTTDDLAFGALKKDGSGERFVLFICNPCRNEKHRISARNKPPQDYCSRCYEKKPLTKVKYCSNCNKRNYRFLPTTADFKLDLYLYVKQIIRRQYKLYDLDIFKIIDFWSSITRNHHAYWNKQTSEQIDLMFNDLVEYLKGDKKTNKNGTT